MNNKKKYALVTGGSGLIGREICKKLASDNYSIFIHYNQNKNSAEQVKNEIIASGGDAEIIQFDICDNQKCDEILFALTEEFPIQILVNNAGVYDDMLMAGMRYEQWSKVINTSLNGFFNVTQPLLLPMMQTRWGRIINISSISGVIGNKGQTNYAAAKGGLNAATKSLAKECASRAITVNSIAPGFIDCEAIRKLVEDHNIMPSIPLKRLGTAQEVAELVSFLASEKSSYITGQIINMDGGIT